MLGILGGLGVVGMIPSAWGWKLSLSAIFLGPLVAGVLEGAVPSTCAPAPLPPTTRMAPSWSSVAVCQARGWTSVHGADVVFPVLGSKNAPPATGPLGPWPPRRSHRPLGISVALCPGRRPPGGACSGAATGRRERSPLIRRPRNPGYLNLIPKFSLLNLGSKASEPPQQKRCSAFDDSQLPKYQSRENAQDGPEPQACMHKHPHGKDDVQDPEQVE